MASMQVRPLVGSSPPFKPKPTWHCTIHGTSPPNSPPPRKTTPTLEVSLFYCLCFPPHLKSQKFALLANRCCAHAFAWRAGSLIAWFGLLRASFIASKACCTCLNNLVALSFCSGFLSGCRLRASALYFSFISSSVESSRTCSIWYGVPLSSSGQTLTGSLSKLVRVCTLLPSILLCAWYLGLSVKLILCTFTRFLLSDSKISNLVPRSALCYLLCHCIWYSASHVVLT